MSLSTTLAKALFDNTAESPEELAFRKGDILMVLEQDQEGGPGWWLCSLHGKQGIAPANRLRLLNTSGNPGKGIDACSTSTIDYVNTHNLSRQQTVNSSLSPTDHNGVCQSPRNLVDELHQSPGAKIANATRTGNMCHMDGVRPRSHSSSSPRLKEEWDGAMGGRPRSPSVRGKCTAETDFLYQTPTGLSALTGHRSHEALSSDSVYLTPSAVPRAGIMSGGLGDSESCYLVPRIAGAMVSSEDLYQIPKGAVALSSPALHTQVEQECTTMQQTLTPGTQRATLKKVESLNSSSVSSPGHDLKSPYPTAHNLARTQAKGVLKDSDNLGTHSTPSGARGKLVSGGRGSPFLVRIGKSGIPGSPNFVKKPSPPPPPVRGVTQKKQSGPPTPAPKPALPVDLATSNQNAEKGEAQRLPSDTNETLKEGNTMDKSGNKEPGTQQTAMEGMTGKENQCLQCDELPEQVYDTPPTNRWKQPSPLATCDDEEENIYNTPRVVPLLVGFDEENKIYDVPTQNGATIVAPEAQSETYSIPSFSTCKLQEDEEDVYSVPTLPGQPLVPIEPVELDGSIQTYSVPSGGKLDILDKTLLSSGSIEETESDCRIYDMPALTLDIPAISPARRLSISSTNSGDEQWKISISSLIQTTITTTSSASARDLVEWLNDIQSMWRTGQAGETPPPIQQAWARLTEVHTSLITCGNAPPSEAQRGMVRCTLEDCALLLQNQMRPRLSSQESLSRRPLPALPVSDPQYIGTGMGSRKGSWIQERPLPPPPPPAFPLPLPPTSMPVSSGRTEDNGEEEDDAPGNEYAGIGLTPAPPSLPAGDSVGYVKLQGMPDPSADKQIHSNSSHVTSVPEARMKTHCQMSPSSPLPATLSLEDSELLSFYSSQSLSHLSCLADSIEALFTSVQGNQPPRVFVSRGKSLIVTAHKLVFIGDTLSRLLSSSDLKAKVTTSGARLCQALKAVVVATKGAAQNYPSVSATQDMVDRVAELSQHAAGFAGLLQRLSEIS